MKRSIARTNNKMKKRTIDTVVSTATCALCADSNASVLEGRKSKNFHYEYHESVPVLRKLYWNDELV